MRPSPALAVEHRAAPRPAVGAAPTRTVLRRPILDAVPRTSDGALMGVVAHFLVRRCAWCTRAWTAHGWTVTEDPPAPDAETSTICPDCVEVLRHQGTSH